MAKKTVFEIRKLILQKYSETYVLLTLLSFAASVSITRLFLSLTGYPQIGRGDLHIAHVLWGGLLLFIAALLPLLYANRWIYNVTAILAGVGVGLFIDEVGKFITRSNDYFYPAAAPIIYAFFLLTVLLFTRVRRPHKDDARAAMYHILQDMEEVLDHDLSSSERDSMLNRLDRIIGTSSNPDLMSLAVHLKDFLQNRSLYLAPKNDPWIVRVRTHLFLWEERIFSKNLLRAILIGVLIGWGVYALNYPVDILSSIHSPIELQTELTQLFQSRPLTRSGLTFFQIRMGLQGSLGLIMLISAAMIAIGKDRLGIPIAYIGMLFSLTVVNLLLFYYDQFFTIFLSLIGLLILIIIMRYRKRFLPHRG